MLVVELRQLVELFTIFVEVAEVCEAHGDIGVVVRLHFFVFGECFVVEGLSFAVAFLFVEHGNEVVVCECDEFVFG